MDRTLILVKPDAFARGLTGEIIARFENKGLRIVALKHMTVTEDLAKRTTPSTTASRSSASSSSSSPPARSSRWCSRATQAINAARQVIGATNPLEAAPGSIRGDYAIAVGQNMVHGSDSPESGAARGRALLPGTSDPRLARRRSGARSSSDAGIAVRGRPADVEEDDGGRPARGRRAQRPPQGDARCPATLVLGADTVVALDGDILGKPRDAAQAREYLGRLNGRAHEVVGGIALAERRRRSWPRRSRPRG